MDELKPRRFLTDNERCEGRYRVELSPVEHVGTVLANSSFYALNVAEELDCEGEYFVDTEHQQLLLIRFGSHKKHQ